MVVNATEYLDRVAREGIPCRWGLFLPLSILFPRRKRLPFWLRVSIAWFILWLVMASWPWWATHIVLFVHRYLRLFGHCYARWALYETKAILEKPKYTQDDVTVILPTIHNVFQELRPSLLSILSCRPAKLILVTTDNKVTALEKLANSLRLDVTAVSKTAIEVLSVNKANKRTQICEALRYSHVTTAITVLADDDVWWPSTLMPWLLAPFEDGKIGGVGTCQRVKRIEPGTLWPQTWSAPIINWLGATYIERRNWEIAATHAIDGGTSCMSGRTAAYRSEILQGGDFIEAFEIERWNGKILKADDDNFVTRWLVSSKWKTWVQIHPECEVETTLENDYKFFYQCLRWARSNWRSNYTSLFKEGVFRKQWWSTYALHIATFTSLSWLDGLILWSCWMVSMDCRWLFWLELTYIIVFTKTVKLLPLFRKNTRDIIFWPVSVVFGYLHMWIKLHALLTVCMTSWGSRADGDEHNELHLQALPQQSLAMNVQKTDPGLPLYRQGCENSKIVLGCFQFEAS